MADKQSLNATFFAFRKREEGSGVILRASVGFMICGTVLVLAFGALVWALIGDWYASVFSVMAQGGEPPVDMPPPTGMLWIFPAEIIFLFLLFVLLAAYEAACLRWMIRGERSGGFLGITLSADTWRVYLTYWLWFALAIGFMIICMFAFAGLGFSMMGGGESALAGGGMVGLGLAFAIFIAAIFISVRFAPAAATSVARGKFAFFDAWKVSGGRFWALFGAFLLLVIMYIVASIVVQTIGFALIFGAAMSGLDWTGAQENPEAFSQAYFQAIAGMFSDPVAIAMFAVYSLLASAVGLMFYVLFYGVNARAAALALEEGKIAGPTQT